MAGSVRSKYMGPKTAGVYWLAQRLINRGQEVPEILMQVIAKNSHDAIDFAQHLIDRGKEVPEVILQGIAQDVREAEYFAKFLINRGQKVPKIISQTLKNHPHDAK